jgi:hypothetical protein
MMKAEDIANYFEQDNPIESRAWSTDYRGDVFLGIVETDRSNPYIWAVATLDSVTPSDGAYDFQFSNCRAVKPMPVKVQPRLFETGIESWEPLDPFNEEESEAIYSAAEEWMLKKSKKK